MSEIAKGSQTSSGNEKIDNFIQEMQLVNNGYYYNTVFEWIPYNQFNEIKEIGTAYSAVWEDGPLKNSHKKYRFDSNKKYRFDSNKEIVLLCLHSNSQNSIEFVMTKVKY